MTLARTDIDSKINEASSYLKRKTAEMERSEGSGIETARKYAHDKLDELKRLFSEFEKDRREEIKSKS